MKTTIATVALFSDKGAGSLFAKRLFVAVCRYSPSSFNIPMNVTKYNHSYNGFNI